VVIPCSPSHTRVLQRNLVYTHHPWQVVVLWAGSDWDAVKDH